MKKVFFALVAMVCLVLTSCVKESAYTIHYVDNVTEFANVTVFEYDYSNNLLTRREIKDAKPGVYEFLSWDGASHVVIGVEGIVNGKILEWYSAEIFDLSSSTPIDIEVSFTGMNTQDSNPVNPDDHVSRYLYK